MRFPRITLPSLAPRFGRAALLAVACALSVMVLGGTSAIAQAQTTDGEDPYGDAAETPPPVAEAPTPKPSPYSLPWQLRPVPVGNVVRLDSSLAFYENQTPRGGLLFFSGLLASYRIPGTEAPGFGGPGTGLAVIARLAMVHHEPPGYTGSATGSTIVVNPLLGAAWTMKFDAPVRLNFFLGVTIPVGMGGGDAPTDATDLRKWSRDKAARAAAPYARSAMDNALFAVNDCTPIVGLGLSWTDFGVTVQAEATVLQLMRVRGEKDQPEARKTNFTSGLHVGYFFIPELSLGAELRYQRWLNPPIAIEKADNAGHAPAIDQITAAIGLRAHIHLGDTLWIRPGISYSRGLDWPMAGTANHHIVQLDIPVAF